MEEYQKYQQALLSLLLKIPSFDKRSVRDFLLNEIPGGNMIQRSEEKGTDLLYILQYSVEISKEFAGGKGGELPLDTLYRNVFICIPTGINLGNEIEKQCRLLRSALYPEQVEEENPDRPENFIPFTNREKEITEIMESGWQHWYIDAPAGYGKTLLMKELRSKYRKKGFLAAYAEVKNLPTSTLSDIVNQLLQDFNLKTLDSRNEQLLPKALGEKLGEALIRRIEGQSNPKPVVVLLIDNIGANAQVMTLALITAFLDALFDTLMNMSEFSSRTHEAFHFIVAGRYLGKFSDRLEEKGFKREELKPFTKDVVFLTAQKAIHRDRERLRQIAAHSFFLTGGHPACLAKVLWLYKNSTIPPESFLREKKTQIWQEIVKPEVQDIWKNVADLQAEFKILRFYRFFDEQVIKRKLPNDPINLLDALTCTYLVERTARYYSDAITRRLMMLEAINEMDPEDFQKECMDAYSFYLECLADQTLQDRTKWAAEGIFQYIQSYTPLILEPSKREELRTLFYSKEVIDTLLDTFAGKFEKTKRERELGALIETIEEDWELIFLINYYLREERSSQTPWNEMKKFITDWGRRTH